MREDGRGIETCNGQGADFYDEEIPLLEIVTAQEEHISQIASLWFSLMEYQASLDSILTTTPFAEEEFAQTLKNLIDSPDVLVLAAADKGRVFGYAFAEVRYTPSVFLRQKIGYILELYVDPSYRQKGTGRTLVENIFSWFSQKDTKRVELVTLSANKPALEFWKKMGFEIYTHIMFKTI